MASSRPLAVLSYQTPHRKTYDTCCRLKALGYKYVKIFALPLHYVKKRQPLILHRPGFELPIETSVLAKNFGYYYCAINTVDEILEPEKTIFLVCGARILPQEFLKRYQVINAHPGFIPYTRGLDSLKWAVYEKMPIGVTTHLLGEEIDAGEIIERRLVPIYPFDTFHIVAQRQYEMEVGMLVNAVEKIEGEHEFIFGGDNPIHRRMPVKLEQALLERFEEYKQEMFCENTGKEE